MIVSSQSSPKNPQRTPSAGSEALQQLKRGEITVEQYLEAKVDKAAARLGPLVTEEQRQTLREVVWEHCRTDPVVGEYVRRLSGPAMPTDLD